MCECRVMCVLSFYCGTLLPQALYFLGVFTDLRNVSASFVMSGPPRGTVQLPLDKFL